MNTPLAVTVCDSVKSDCSSEEADCKVEAVVKPRTINPYHYFGWENNGLSPRGLEKVKV